VRKSERHYMILPSNSDHLHYCFEPMSIYDEKRAGRERRANAQGEPKYGVERRSGERRQISLTEITFVEWATKFAEYLKQIKK